MDGRIRVLEVVEAITGGTKKHVLSLVKSLDRSQFNLTVVCPQIRSHAYGDTSFARELEAVEDVGILFIEMERMINVTADTKTLMTLYRVIREGQYNIVHAHSSKAGGLGRLSARWAGTPIILYTPHGFAFRGVRNPLKRWIFLWIERLCGLWTDRIICVSLTEKKEALKNRVAAEDKLVVIENGLDLEEFDLALDPLAMKQSLGLNLGSSVVGTVGRLSWDKGFQYFLEAATRVTVPDVHFLIVGDGEARDDLEQLAAKLGISHQTIFTGFRADVLDILSVMDVFVLPSPYEAMPYTVLEAMASQKPVVAIEGTGAQEVVRQGETGLLVPPRDAEAMAFAITDLLKDPIKARAMGVAGRKVIESRFTLARMIQQTAELYHSLWETTLASPFVSGRRIA